MSLRATDGVRENRVSLRESVTDSKRQRGTERDAKRLRESERY